MMANIISSRMGNFKKNFYRLIRLDFGNVIFKKLSNEIIYLNEKTNFHFSPSGYFLLRSFFVFRIVYTSKSHQDFLIPQLELWIVLNDILIFFTKSISG